jgi:hypothetical protein
VPSPLWEFHLCRPIGRHYKAVLLVALVLTVVGGILTSRLSLESDLAALLPESLQSVEALHRMEERVVGGSSQLRVALKSQDFRALVQAADTLARAFETSEYVASVDYENDVEFYERNALLFLDLPQLDSLEMAVQETIEEEKQALNPFMVEDLFGGGEEEEETDDLARWEEEYQEDLPERYYLNPDSTVLVMSLNPTEGAVDLSFAEAMVEDARRIVEEADLGRFASDLEVFYGSNVKNRIDEFRAIRSDIVGTAGYGITGVILILMIVFRSLVVALLVAVSLGASLSWTFGLTYLMVGQLNTITGFLFVVLFAMGIDYGIHAMARYRESRQAGLDLQEAIHRMVCKTGSALTTTAVTTSAAFFSLMLLDFKGFSELGLITGMGMIFALLAMVVLLPSLVILSDGLGILKVKRVPGRELTSDERPLPFARGILAVAVLLTLVFGYLFTRIGFQYDFTDLRIITEERQEYARVTSGVFTRSESPAMILTDSREEARAVVEEVRELMRTDTVSPTVESVQSILSVLPANQEEKLARIRDIRRLVEEEAEGVVEGEDARRVERLQEFLAVDEGFSWEEFPPEDRARFTNREGEPGNFVLIFPSVALRDGRNAMAFRDDIGTIVTDSGQEFHAASSNLIVADMLTMITHEGPVAVVLSLTVVFLIILANFRSVGAAVLVVLPLMLGLVWLGGIMHLVGMKLNFFNVVVFPSVVGIGVDDGVHIYHRYREEGPGSLPFVLKRTGLAVTITTVTTMVGYSGLLLAVHPGLQSIGLAAVIGLGTAFLTAVFVLPAILEILQRRTSTLEDASS